MTQPFVNPQRRPIAIGKAFENLVESSQNDAQGPVCVLVKIGNFAQRVPKFEKGPDGVPVKGVQIVEQKSPFDFAGSVWGTGIGIFLDCKSCNEKVASLHTNQSDHVKPHQIHAMRRLSDARAIAGFLVECKRMNDYRFLMADDADLNAPVRWDSPKWFVLGPIREGYGVPLRKLVEAYK